MVTNGGDAAVVVAAAVSGVDPRGLQVEGTAEGEVVRLVEVMVAEGNSAAAAGAARDTTAATRVEEAAAEEAEPVASENTRR